MQQDRFVKVHGTRFGTGYLIAPRLVLTAAHVVAPDGTAEVTLPGSDARFPAVVLVHGGDRLDAALVQITAEDWAPPATVRGRFGRSPQRWGRCVTGGLPVPVVTMGFPRQQRGDDGRAAEQVNAHLRPRGRLPFELLDPNSPLGRPDDPNSPYAGLSGAAVFPETGDLLLGVVIEDRRPQHGTRLTAVRAEDLLADDEFRAVLRAATEVDPQLEPVELADLLEQASPRAVHSPTMLLRASAEVVPFHGRTDVLDLLEQWCLADETQSVRVLTGPGGQGKTRLARQLVARLRGHGWVTGEVRGDPGEPRLRVLRAVQHPLLLVVDYAESRPDLVRRLREETEEIRHPVRLLLLARSVGSWKTRATGQLREVQLHALSPSATEREQVFRLAAHGFADRLADGVGRADVDWHAVADTVPVTGRGPGPETALTIQLAALLALLRQAHDPDGRPLEAELLEEHESKYWMDSANQRRVRTMDPELLERAVATAVLCPAADRDEAVATMARLMPREPLVEDVAAWLRDLYPPPEGHYWGQLEPDRLGEHLAVRHVLDDPALLPRLFAEAPDHQRVQTLTVLARAAVAHANENRAADAGAVVGQLRAVLRTVPAHAPLTSAVLRAHSDALPAQSHVLRDYALDVARELSRLCDATGADQQALPDRGWALHNLAERHLAVGDWAAAVDAADAAARLREEPAATGATTARTEWADSLLLLSRACCQVGQMARSHQAGEQALAQFRALVALDGDEQEKRERGLVRALINQAQVVWRLDPETIGFDRVARSNEYSDEAVQRARVLMAVDTEPDPLLLIDALTQRGQDLWRLRRRTALHSSEEAVRTARRLAVENHDAYAGNLATALLGLAVDYADTERTSAAVELDREVIALLSALAEDLPERYAPSLAQTWTNLAWNQLSEQDSAAARASVTKAIEYRRLLAEDHGGLRLPSLASAVYTLGVVDAGDGDHHSAVLKFTEALDTYARTPVALSSDELRRQSSAALELALSYEALGRTADAFAAANRAGVIRRRLSEYGPSLYSADYAAVLGDLSGLHRRQGERVTERILLRHALPIHRELARENTSEREQLAYCLADLGASYAASWATVDRAVSTLTEAYELLVELPDKNTRQLENLAFTCQELARALLGTSRFTDAVRVAEHEVRLRRQLAAADPAGHDELRYTALLRLARSLTMAGQPAAGWRAAVEAEQLCHALVDRPGEAPATVAWLLCSLARTISLCGRHDPRLVGRALNPAREAARVYQQLTDRDPDEHQASRRWAVDVLATVLTRLGRHAEAAEARLSRGAR